MSDPIKPVFNVGSPGKGGRRPKGDVKEAVIKAHQAGMTVQQLAIQTGVTPDTIYKTQKRLGLPVIRNR